MSAKLALFIVKNRKTIKKLVAGIIILVVGLVVFFFANPQMQETQTEAEYETYSVSDAVLKWKPAIEKELKKYGLEKHLALVLAIVQQESGGTASLDVMQASESIGLPPNSITDPYRSIEIGVSYFKGVIDKMTAAGVDLDTAIQSYNYGAGFIDYVAARGKKYTKNLALQFSREQAARLGWSNYGDPDYVDHVRRYLNEKKPGVNKPLKGEFKKVMDAILKFNGDPYVFGGKSPITGFDCSGIVTYGFEQIGINNFPSYTVTQWEATKPVSLAEAKPGDLVFFRGTYGSPDFISHIEFYIDSKTMYGSNSSGIGYHDLSDPYWQAHFAGVRRLVEFK